jgi:hypothetical protein
MAAATTPILQQQRRFELAMAQLDTMNTSSQQRPIFDRRKTLYSDQEAISAAAQALHELWQKQLISRKRHASRVR